MILLLQRLICRVVIVVFSVILLQLHHIPLPLRMVCAATRVEEAIPSLQNKGENGERDNGALQIQLEPAMQGRKLGVSSSIRYLCDPSRLACVLPAVVVTNVAFDPQQGVMHFYSGDAQVNITHVSLDC